MDNVLVNAGDAIFFIWLRNSPPFTEPRPSVPYSQSPLYIITNKMLVTDLIRVTGLN